MTGGLGSAGPIPAPGSLAGASSRRRAERTLAPAAEHQCPHPRADHDDEPEWHEHCERDQRHPGRDQQDVAGVVKGSREREAAGAVMAVMDDGRRLDRDGDGAVGDVVAQPLQLGLVTVDLCERARRLALQTGGLGGAVAAGVDISGNVWVANEDGSVSELLGAGTPTVAPLSPTTLGKMP